MGAPLLGTNGPFVFTAAEMADVQSQTVRSQTVHEREGRIIKDLLARFKSRREQIAEWRRLTGKCRRTFEHRLIQATSEVAGAANGETTFAPRRPRSRLSRQRGMDGQAANQRALATSGERVRTHGADIRNATV